MDRRKLLTWPPAVMFLALVCAVLWGSAFPCVKMGIALLGIANTTGGKLYFAAYRFLFAGLLIFAGLACARRPISLPLKKDYAIVLVLGILQTTLQYAFFYIGLSHTTGVKASIIIGSGSFFMALFSHWWIRDDFLNTKKTIGLVLGFMGIVLVNLHKQQLDLEFRLTGEGFILLTALVSTLGVVIVKKASVRIHPPLLSAYQLTLGALVLLGIAGFTESPAILRFSATSLFLLFYLSVVSAVAFSLWYLLIKYNHLTHMAVYRFLIPICGVFLSAVVLPAESLNWLSLGALALVSSGIFLTSKQES